MDIGGALAVLVRDPSAAECPLARLAAAFSESNAPTVREAALIHLKTATEELENAEARIEQAKIARDKLKAELQRIESLTLEALTSRQEAQQTIKLCKALIASGFVDNSRMPNPQVASAAMEFEAPVLGHGATHDAPPPLYASASAIEHPSQIDAPTTAERRNVTLPVDAAIMALESEIEMKESSLLQTLGSCEIAAQRDSDPTWESNSARWQRLCELVWENISRARPTVQLAQCGVLKSIFRRVVQLQPSISRETPSLIVVAAHCGATASLTKLIGSINDDVKAEAFELVTTLNAFPETSDAFLRDTGLASSVIKVVETSNSEPVLERALTALWTLASCDTGKSMMFTLGAMNAVLSLVFSDSIAILDNVMMALGQLTRDPRCKAAMRDNGGLEKLVASLLHPSPLIRVKAAGSIWNCAADPDNRVQLLKLGAVPLLIEQLAFRDTQENAGGALWNLALENDGKVALLEYGGIPVMVNLLASSDAAVVENVSGTLWNCSSTLENRAAMRKFGALPPIVSLLRSPVDSIRENAAGALRNLVINDQNKVAAREAGAIDLIIDIIDTARDTFLEKLVATLLVLSVPPENKHAIRLARGFPKLLDLLSRPGMPAVNKEKIIGTLRNCSGESENRVPLLELGVVRLSIQTARELGALDRPPRPTPQFREHLAVLLWNVAKDEKVIPGREGAMEILVGLLDDPHDAVVEQAAAAISTLASNTPENKERMFAIRAVEKLGIIMEHAATHQRPVVLQHVLHAVKHGTASHEGNQRQLAAVKGIIPRLLTVVSVPPIPSNLEGASRCAEDVVREGVFCLRNIASTAAGAELLRQNDAIAILQKVAEGARTETIRIATSVVLQSLLKRTIS